MAIYDAAVAADDFKNAARCVSLLKALPLHAPKMAAQISARTQGLPDLTAAYQGCRTPLATLRSDPSSPEANEAVGRYECFVKGDWDSGLPRLALSANQNLGSTARLDLSRPSEASMQIKLADGWAGLSNNRGDLTDSMIRHRAANWYFSAAPQLEGLSQAAARHHALAMEAPKVLHGVIFFLSDMPEVDAVVGYGWFGKSGNCGFNGGRIAVNGVPSPHGLGTHAIGGSPAHVSYELSGAFDTFETGVAFDDSCLEVHAPLTFRVIGDGNILWVSDPIAKVRLSQNCAIDVLGVKKLTLEVITSDAVNGHAVWIEPQLIRR